MCRVQAYSWITCGAALMVVAALAATTPTCRAMTLLPDTELAQIKGYNKIWDCKPHACCDDPQHCCIVDADAEDKCIPFAPCPALADYCQKKECHTIYLCGSGNKMANCEHDKTYACTSYFGGPRQAGGDPCVCSEWCGGTNDVGCDPNKNYDK